MDEPKIRFGDKLFLSGDFLRYVDSFGEYESNTFIAEDNVLIQGYVVEILSAISLATVTLFNQVDMVDITGSLFLNLPLPAGTKIWMLTTP